MKLDLINSGFQLLGAIAAWANCYKLHKEKVIRGVYWPVYALYSAWGLWNLVYYWGLNQPYSFFMGIVLVLGNLTWVAMALRIKGSEFKVKLLDKWSKVV